MLDNTDIQTLNAARKILRRIDQAARTQAWDVQDEGVDGHDLGRLSEASDMAEGAIFNVLNTARSYCHVTISDAEMHMREEVEV